jgi:5-methylcytosine-specific restriction enzyme subunit McrC
VTRHARKSFWKNQNGRHIVLEPDLVIKKGDRTIVLDTKWKYRKGTSPEDVRQMYAYGVYFQSHAAYLLYPDNLNGSLSVSDGNFFNPDYLPIQDKSNQYAKESCGLIFIDPIKGAILDKSLGSRLLDLVLLN